MLRVKQMPSEQHYYNYNLSQHVLKQFEHDTKTLSHTFRPTCQWRHGRWEDRGAAPLPLNFGLLETCWKILSENLNLKMKNLGLQTPIFGKFGEII